ncbi:PREDICTED: pentatricopeptide repeat-containing protein At4g39952, mitochondrial-like [Fragaria vesca subsp. vesca]
MAGLAVHGLVSRLGLFARNSTVGVIFCLRNVRVRRVWSVFVRCIGLVEMGRNQRYRDVLSWTPVIGAYARAGCLLSGFRKLTTINEGKAFLGLIIRQNYGSTQMVYSELVSMYCKFGLLTLAEKIFNEVQQWEKECCNNMICNYAKLGQIHRGQSVHGYIIKVSMDGNVSVANSLIDMYGKSEEVKPNSATFVTVLSACSHLASLKEGEEGAGKLQEAKDLVLSMPIAPDGGVWGFLLGACKIHNNIEIGARVAKHAIESDPENDGYHVMLSNLYSSIGRWDDAISVRKMMEEKVVGKICMECGLTWVIIFTHGLDKFTRG